MPRRRPNTISINHERWLVSYSDFITLLFAFFVVMYSISQVSESKYRVLSDTLMDAFSTEQRSISPIQVGEPSVNFTPSAITAAEPEVGEFTGDGAFDKTADLPQLTESFAEQFSDLIDDQLVQVNSNEFWLQIDISSNVLFASGKAQPSLQAQVIFDEVAQMLKGFDNPIQVEGFTDNVPINTPKFPSNWELSAARAAAIVKLLMVGEIAPERLSAVGYGEYRPISDNGTEAGRLQNRRVALMISRQKTDRPRVKNLSEVEEAVQGTQIVTSQPYPQPEDSSGFTAPVTATAEGLSEEALKERLDSLLTQGEDETSTSLGRILDTTEEAESTDSTPEAPPKAPPARAGNIQPVELEGGGLIFSNDPNLPRQQP